MINNCLLDVFFFVIVLLLHYFNANIQEIVKKISNHFFFQKIDTFDISPFKKQLMEYLIKNLFLAIETILFIWVIEKMSYNKKSIPENIQSLR